MTLSKRFTLTFGGSLAVALALSLLPSPGAQAMGALTSSAQGAHAQASATTDPPVGDTETNLDTVVSKTDAAAVRAYLELTLACMKTHLEVSLFASSETVLGSMSTSGVSAPPTGTEASPSETCADAGVDPVEAATDGATEEAAYRVKLVAMRQTAITQSTLPRLQPAGNPGESVTAGRVIVTPNLVPDPDVSLSTERYWLNIRGQRNSINSFMSNRYSPGFLVWATNGCSSPLKNRSTKYNFLNACIRHDFNYGNLQAVLGYDYRNKSRADSRFGSDMRKRCAAFSAFSRIGCRAMAAVYENAVRTGRRPVTLGSPYFAGNYTW